jgi:cytochrome c-type biogenesis protein CcmH/NrfF
MMKKLLPLVLLFMVAFQLKVMSQSAYSNPVILAHYDSTALAWMESNDLIKFNTVVYYYTQSFIVEKLDCENCENSSLNDFDVSKYEQFREKNTRYVRVYPKEGFKLTLLSMSELLYKMPIHTVKLAQ